MAKDTAVPLNRIERILRNMIASAAGLSGVAIVAIIIASFARIDTNAGLWLTVKVLPLIGLALAAVLLLVFVILAVARRSRLARD